MIIFISGASGYLGSHLVRALSKEHRVFALLRSSSSRERIKDINVETINLDEDEVLETAFSVYRPDVIINTAALYGRNGESLSALVRANIDFPTQLLELAYKYNTKGFIHTGTSLPDDVSTYALTKNTFAKLAEFTATSTLKFINVELEHFYGPGDDDSKFVSYVLKECIKNNTLKLTDGTQQRDFIYIDDVISAYKVLMNNFDKLTQFETVSVGTGEAPTVRTFVELIHTYTHSESKLEFGAVEMRYKELMLSCADIDRLKFLGWECKYSVEDRIKHFINTVITRG